MPQTVEVTPALVAFAQEVLEIVEAADEDQNLQYDDAIQCDGGYGGIGDDGNYALVFFPEDRDEAWSFVLQERALRDLAHGFPKRLEVEATEHRRAPEKLKQPKRAVAAGSTVGERLVALLVAQELLRLAGDATPGEVGAAVEGPLLAALDDASLSDAERAESIGELLAGQRGVDEIFATDDELLAAAKRADT